MVEETPARSTGGGSGDAGEKRDGLQPSTSGANAQKPPLAPKLTKQTSGGQQGYEKTPTRKTKKTMHLTVNPNLLPMGMSSPHSMETTPKKRRCNCKQSRCLKLYCECFASGIYCNDCNCQDCYNNKDHEQVRQEAVEATLERNPDAFRPKIQSMSPGMSLQDSLKHNKGCNCKRSFCLKRYCECFQAEIYCSDNCRCIDCKNFEGSAARAQLLQSPSSRLQSASKQDYVGMSPRAKRAKHSKASVNGKDVGKILNGDALVHGAADMLQVQTNNGEIQFSAAGGKQQGVAGAMNAAGISPLVNQMLLPRSMLAGVINENVVKHLSTLLCMVAQEKEDKFRQTASSGETANQPELSDTLTDKENPGDEEGQNEDNQLEKTLLCEEEPQGLFDLDSPKGYQLNKTSLQTGSVSKSKQQGGDPKLSFGATATDGGEITTDTNAMHTMSASANQRDTMISSPSTAPGLVGVGGGVSISGSVSKGPGSTSQSVSNVSQVYIEQEKAILTELNNCLQVVSQMGRQQAEYVRFLLSPVIPVHMLNTPAANNNTPKQQ